MSLHAAGRPASPSAPSRMTSPASSHETRRMRREFDRITVWCGGLSLLGLICVAFLSV
jgi:hypothetical protein